MIKFFHRSQLQVMGIQEPHITDEASLLSLQVEFAKISQFWAASGARYIMQGEDH